MAPIMQVGMLRNTTGRKRFTVRWLLVVLAAVSWALLAAAAVWADDDGTTIHGGDASIAVQTGVLG